MLKNIFINMFKGTFFGMLPKWVGYFLSSATISSLHHLSYSLYPLNVILAWILLGFSVISIVFWIIGIIKENRK